MTISVLLADDQHLVRAGFRSLLKLDKDITVVGEVSTADEAVRAARTSRPDVILMDIRMPGLDGIAATKQITGDPALRDSRVVILTTFETDELLSPSVTRRVVGQTHHPGHREARRPRPRPTGDNRVRGRAGRPIIVSSCGGFWSTE